MSDAYTTLPSCRLFLRFAREAPVAIILRRGPTRWVQLIRWDTATDTFEEGQWFNGRIYEHYADLSPDGELLIYGARKEGAAKRRRYPSGDIGECWTAISRPPYLTALALWGHPGFCVGGGQFERPRVAAVATSPGLARAGSAVPWGKLRVRFQDAQHRLGNDLDALAGWSPVDASAKKVGDWLYWRLDTFYERKCQTSDVLLWRRSMLREQGQQAARLQDHFYVRNVAAEIDLGELDAADFDFSGRLVIARDGKILVCERPESEHLIWRELADFSANKPRPIKAPPNALRWPK